MGGIFSSSEKDLCLPYIFSHTSEKLVPIIDIELEIKKSTLPSYFIEDKDNGVFTKKFIPHNSIIYDIAGMDKSYLFMNDVMINLSEIASARNNKQMYHAWKNLESRYYDYKKVKELVNVKMTEDITGKTYYISIKDIEPDTELLRIYGFPTWFGEAFELYTNKNVFGFIKYVNEFLRNMGNDPYRNRIISLVRELNKLKTNSIDGVEIKDFDNLEELDDIFFDLPTIDYYDKLINASYWASVRINIDNILGN